MVLLLLLLFLPPPISSLHVLIFPRYDLIWTKKISFFPLPEKCQNSYVFFGEWLHGPVATVHSSPNLINLGGTPHLHNNWNISFSGRLGNLAPPSATFINPPSTNFTDVSFCVWVKLDTLNRNPVIAFDLNETSGLGLFLQENYGFIKVKMRLHYPSNPI